MPSREEQKGDFKHKLRHWFHDTMKKTKVRLDKAQGRYKNYDKRLRKQSEFIHVVYYVYLWVERNNRKDRRHKLAAIVKSPFKVTNVDDSTVVFENTDRSVENVSLPRIALTAEP